MICITIPVYYTKSFKTKKDKTFLVTLNWYRNAHHYEQNIVKQYFAELIKEQLTNAKPLDNKYCVSYEYYYKNPVSDMPNVTAMCSKWVNDALQDLNLIPNDNVQYLVQETHRVRIQDKDNPRCIIRIDTYGTY